MSSSPSKLRSRQAIESPRRYDVLKKPILFDYIPLKDMPSKEPEIRFGNSNIERLPTKYKDVLRNIVRTIAMEGGWSTARINKDIHNTTTRGTHRKFDRRLPLHVIGGGRGIQITPDDPHLTVAMESEEFPSLNRTVHINTTVVPGDAGLSEPQNRAEMFDTQKYPLGFPFDHLRAKGLSEHSARLQPPKQEYARRYNIWRRKQQKLAKKETLMSFESFPGDCPESPARSAPSRTFDWNSSTKDSSKRPVGSNNRFSILEFLSEPDDISDDIANDSSIPSSTKFPNNTNEYTTQPETQTHAKPSFAHVARYTTPPTTPDNATVTTTRKPSGYTASPAANTSSHVNKPKTPTPTSVPKMPVTSTTNNPPAAPKPSPAKKGPPAFTGLSTRKTANKPGSQPRKTGIDGPAATVAKPLQLVQGPWLRGPPRSAQSLGGSKGVAKCGLGWQE